VGLYLNPPENAVVLSIDEKTSIQALERTQDPRPLRTGRAMRHTHDYNRHGVVDLYAALNVATGQVAHTCTRSLPPASRSGRRGMLGVGPACAASSGNPENMHSSSPQAQSSRPRTSK